MSPEEKIARQMQKTINFHSRYAASGPMLIHEMDSNHLDSIMTGNHLRHVIMDDYGPIKRKPSGKVRKNKAQLQARKINRKRK